MFEDMTFENIMEAMMEEMPDDIDTSEGSVIPFVVCRTGITHLHWSFFQKHIQP